MNIQDMTLKERNELLSQLWNDASVTLLGFQIAIVSSIDRGQAVSDYGVAQYDSYQFLLPYETEDDEFVFSAEDIEAFARTW